MFSIYNISTNHSTVSLVLQFNHLSQKRGPGFCKSNAASLKNEEYVTALSRNTPILKEKYELHDLGFKMGPRENGGNRFHDQVLQTKSEKYQAYLAGGD